MDILKQIKMLLRSRLIKADINGLYPENVVRWEDIVMALNILAKNEPKHD